VVLFFALLISYPWPVLTIGVLLYLSSLPFGYVAYRNYERQAAEAAAVKSDAAPGTVPPIDEDTSAPPPGASSDGSERPTRLN
jgi:CDP-diacylglycerol--serine O-phosphatidyltransferase